MLLFNNPLTFSFHCSRVAMNECYFWIKNGCHGHDLYSVSENIYPATDALHSIPFTAHIILGGNIFQEGSKLLKFNLGEFVTKYNNVSGKRIDKPLKNLEQQVRWKGVIWWYNISSYKKALVALLFHRCLYQRLFMHCMTCLTSLKILVWVLGWGEEGVVWEMCSLP